MPLFQPCAITYRSVMPPVATAAASPPSPPSSVLNDPSALN
ncbi:Uncharacterised protein [Mycobacteroides abscessus subsp. abscessus]|nr:Uncharacterised protein [Mycobacteroides abscessus subsp. abscessus]